MRFLIPVLIAASVAACGGGGGGGDSTPPPPPLSGQIVKGPVAGATVSLYSMNVDGTRTLLAATTSDASGSYSFSIAPGMNSVVLVEASGGTYLDEISASRVALGSTLRGATVISSAVQRISVSPFSEAAVREIDSASPKNWAAGRVNQVNADFSGVLGVTDLLQLTAADLSSDSAAAHATDDDFFLTIELGGFTGLVHRLSLTLDQGLDAIHTALADPFDDRYNPAWIQGIVDFIDTTGLSAEPSADPFDPNPVPSKRELKAAILLLGTGGSDAELAAALPTGQATGSTTAPMPDDAFQIVSDPNFIIGSPVGTVFNSRGALAAYQVGAGIDRYHYIYSASVGEVYGDGDVGVGRWHGGVVFDSNDGRAMETATNPQILTATNGESYAVAIPATNVPSCGARLLQMVASTKPTQSGTLETKVVTGLTADSMVGIQYVGTTAYVGVDFGLRLSDNTVFRARTPGGASAPWASGASPGTDKSFSTFSFPSSPPALVPSVTISANGILAGSGGRKTAMKIRIQGPTFDAETIAAAFSAPDMPPDSSGCAVAVTGDGSQVASPPTDGSYIALAGVTDGSAPLFLGAPLLTTFRPSGAILTSGLDPNSPQLSIPPDTPMFELAGNSNAVIGRAKGPFTFRGTDYNRSLPFAAAAAPGVFPTSGAKHYVLVASTAAIATIGTGPNFFEGAPGQVTSATVDINFGEFPLGTPNQFSGSARVSIQGTVAGVGFQASNPQDSNGGISDIVYFPSGAVFGGGGNIVGAVTGANAEFAVVWFVSSIGVAPVQGALLLQAQ